MKRYDLIEYRACGTFDRMMDERPNGDYVEYADLQARDLKLAELVGALPHKPGCPSELCAKCCQHIDGHEFADFDHPFAPMTCKCARGKALALLGES